MLSEATYLHQRRHVRNNTTEFSNHMEKSHVWLTVHIPMKGPTESQNYELLPLAAVEISQI